MLKFFRQIRQKLLVEGSLRKYLVYAVGEIILVIIGILIAIQINNWNESRKQQAEERQILARMVLELDRNIDRMQELDSSENHAGWPIAKTLIFFDSLAVVIADGVDTSEIDFICSGPLFRFNSFNLSSDIFEEMKFRGYLYNLKSKALSQEIQSYYSLIEREALYNELTREPRNKAIDGILFGFRRLKRDYARFGIQCLSYHKWIFDDRSEEYFNFELYVSTIRNLTNRSRGRMLNVIEASERLKRSILDSI